MTASKRIKLNITRKDLLEEATKNWYFQNYLLNSLKKQIKLDEKKRIVKNLNKEIGDYELTDIVERVINETASQIGFNREAIDFLKENYIYSYEEAIDSGAKTCLDFYQYYFRFKAIEAFDLLVKTIRFRKTK